MTMDLDRIPGVLARWPRPQLVLPVKSRIAFAVRHRDLTNVAPLHTHTHTHPALQFLVSHGTSVFGSHP